MGNPHNIFLNALGGLVSDLPRWPDISHLPVVVSFNLTLNTTDSFPFLSLDRREIIPPPEKMVVQTASFHWQ